MWGAAAALPEQVEAAVSAARGVKDLPRHERVENVVVLGMGGSGIAGDVLAAAAAPFMPVPVTVVKGYRAPRLRRAPARWSSPSRSPATPRRRWRRRPAAFEAGASLIVVAGGGALVSLAGEWDVPVVPGPGRHPPAPGRARGHGHPPAGAAGGDRAVPRCPPVGRPGRRPAPGPPRRAGPAGQPGRGPGPPHRPDHPPRPQLRGPGRGRRPAVEGPDQRERQDARPSSTSIPSSATTRWPAGVRTGTPPAS